ncbi:DUF3293 domain-containing protein [Gayadomonas joobiniege]|uniref:DUF3293 domain-containing protein n=1 Tax=Gayadomonas joobiniege TaxID=1234606 RepID=UPI0003800693|nr:DUF3293 domain-containing protein [Gayadomonas joobiniege]
MASLWQKYQNVVFELEQSVSEQLSLAIITAYNPRGELLSNGHNRMLDKTLLKDIDSLNVPYRRIVGCDPNRTHSEPSWLVAMDKSAAIELGNRYQQNAIYWVEANQLYLTPCQMQQQEICLGSFSQRVILTEGSVAL